MKLRTLLVLGFALAGLGGTAAAQDVGFQLNRYEPTAAGEWFFAVEHPWYSGTRYFAGGLTLNYGHNPLVIGKVDDGQFTMREAVIGHQLIGHIDLAGSFLDRVRIHASLPITLLERGNAAGGVEPSGVSAGDPRVGVTVRLFGQPERQAISMSLSATVWIPIGNGGGHAGDAGWRFLPRLVLGGMIADHLRWSFNLGFLVRSEANLTETLPAGGNTAGNEIQIGVGLGYANSRRTFHIGPELLLASVVAGGQSFTQDYTSLELLLGAQYLIADTLLIGLAGGTGILQQPGTPDFRGLLRLAYAPMRREVTPLPPRDTDGDGIPDDVDACRRKRGVPSSDPRKHGCPPPPADRDRDGVVDEKDQCPDEPQGQHPDPTRRGCPDGDRDGDGVYDAEDLCFDVPAGPHPDPERKGCPDGDKDKDRVFDHEDVCPTVPLGPYPDPDRKGCPLGDRDGDTIPDMMDACPDQPGAPNPDPKKNGCPGLVAVKDGKIVIMKPVYFATDKDVILGKSFPVLNAVADALIAQPHIRLVSIDGHTDSRGGVAHNRDLSQRRAASVLKFLAGKGVAADRLEAHGFGPDKPIADNRTSDGRAQNRRVEFNILQTQN